MIVSDIMTACLFTKFPCNLLQYMDMFSDNKVGKELEDNTNNKEPQGEKLWSADDVF